MPDRKAPEIIIGPDPEDGDEGGEDEAVDLGDVKFVNREREDVRQLDNKACTNSSEEDGDKSSSKCDVMRNFLDTFGGTR